MEDEDPYDDYFASRDWDILANAGDLNLFGSEAE